MSYNELKLLIDRKNSTVKDVAEQLDFTPTGFKRAIDNESFPIGKVLPLCEILEITAAQFFGEEPIEPSGKAVRYHQSGSVNMIASEVGHIGTDNSEVKFLREQVRELTKMNSELIKKMK